MKKRLLSFVMAAAMLFGSAAALPEGAFSFETGIVASADSTSGVWKNSQLSGNNVKWQIKETQAGKTLILSGEGKTIVDSYWGNYLVADGHWNPAGITDIIVGKGISAINTYAFWTADSNNYYLKSITISDSVKEINGNIDGMWSHSDGPQSQCVIYYASAGSAAQAYAEKNGFQNSICVHEYEEISIAPTCLDLGYTAQRCKKCFDTYGYVYSDELGHDYTETVIAPSCTAKGYTIHTCSRCKDKYIDSETDKISHNYGSWTLTDMPTCTKSGVETRTCKTCGASQTREVETLGHNYESTVVSPTCKQDGYTLHKCSNCGDEYSDNKTTMLGHDYKTTVVDPTCTEEGYTLHKCSRCDDFYKENYTDAKGHDFGEWKITTQPTATTNGEKARACKNCDVVETETVEFVTIVDSGTCGTDVSWTLNNKGVLTISGTGPMNDYGEISEPFYHKSYTPSPFDNRNDITSVVIESGVTSIGIGAFYDCKSITNITIPNSVKNIGGYAFYGCTNLESVNIPKGVEYINSHTFYGCSSLSRATLPNTVKIIDKYAFFHCTSLTDIILPERLSKIDYRAFLGCTSLSGITISCAMETGAFSGCTSLSSVTISDGCGRIPAYAFANCTSLTSITIPKSVSQIDSSAFKDCTNLSEITALCDIISVADDSFNGTKWYNDQCKNGPFVILGKTLISAKGCVGDVTIPFGVKSIGDKAFSGCSNLGSVEIPSSVTRIGSSAFADCKSLTSVSIPFGITRIGNEAFRGCSKLESVDIPSSVTQISYYAFLNCGFKSVTIPKTVEYIGTNAFGFIHSSVYGSLGGIFSKISDFKIYCFEGSQAETYAKDNGFDYDYCICKHDYKQYTIDPTCTSDGSIKTICVHCGTQYGQTTVIKALGHDYIETGIVEPTCTKRGYTEYICTRCNRKNESDYVKALGHNYIGTVTAPNCTEKGYTTHVCSRCSDSYVDSYTDPVADAHIYGDWVVTFETTDTICGTKERLCKLCKHRDVLVDHDKKYIKRVKPTCTEKGYDIYNCKRCGEEFHENIVDAKGHNWSDWVTTRAATCTAYGEQEKTCYSCKTIETKRLDKLGHNYKDTVVKPTCIKQGYTEHKCSRCGDYYNDTYTATTDHNWSGWSTTLNPTCSYDGEKERKCYACGLTETQTISKTSHSYTKTIVNPTMTQDGYTTYKCSICGYSYKGDITKAATSGKCGDNLTWTFSNGRLTISGTGSMYNWDPNNNKNSPFTSDKITSIVIGNGVTSIGNWAFNGCTKLKSVSIPATVKTIGEGAFQNCYLLSSVAIPNGVTSIGDGAFWCCLNLASVSLPSSLRTIGYLTFGGCTSLKSIVIPNGVTTIGEAAFSGSNSLASISIPSTVKSIGARAFDSTKWLSTMRSKNPLVVVNGLLVDAQTYKGATLTLSSSIKGICGSAFSECNNLISITIPSSVTSIGNDAFYNCAKLKSIVIPNNVQSIEDFTFYGCTSLSSVTIGSGVKSIGYSAFYGTQNLKSITIPASVGTIDKYALGYYYDSKTQKTVKVSGFTISGYTGSAAEKYAKDNGFKFVSKGTHTHSYTNTVVPATCKDKGYTVHTCKNCGYSYTDSYTAVNNNAHRFGAWSVSANASTSTNGSLKRTCSLCGTTETSPYVYYSRIAGQNRFATAAAVSRASFPSADTVVLAFGLNYADALAGVPLATKLNAPILLTYKDSLPSETLTEIKRLGAKNIVILGGTGAISTTVENQLVSNGIIRSRITRYAGSSRYGTATSVAKALNSKPTELFFVYAGNSADALSVSVIAAVKGAPIIYLKTNGTLDDATKAYLASVKGYVKRAYVIGGTGVISDAMKKLADNALGIISKRLYGKDRYETCVAVNNEFKSLLTSKSICIATGLDYPDALAGGVLAALNKSPLFLINGKISLLTLSDTQKNLIKSRKPSNINVFGGTGAVSENSILTVSAECAKS